jgi:glycosyltransferase involved in cell wall biosynthesis
VATDVPGSREVIVDGQTGALAAADSVEALHGAMIQMMRLPTGERLAIGLRARLRVLERFSLTSVLDQWEALYASLLERNPRPQRWGGAS